MNPRSRLARLEKRTGGGPNSWGDRILPLIRGQVDLFHGLHAELRYFPRISDREAILRRAKTDPIALPVLEEDWRIRQYPGEPLSISLARDPFARYFDDHVIGRVRIDQLNPAGIRRFYVDLQERGLSPRTVQYAHSVLHAALEQAVEDGLIPRNPAKLARKALAKVERSEKQVLSLEQARTFIQYVQADRYSAFWLLLLDTRLRPAEALGLKWSDVDFDAGVIRIQRALKEPLEKGSTAWRLERPKTKQAVRSVPIMPETLRALKEHRKRQLQDRLAAGESWSATTEPNMVFLSSTGTHPRQSNLLRRHFKPILTAAKLPEMRVYELRHSAASILLALGENPKVVQERLGHRDVGLTLNTYSHVVHGLQQQATARMAQALAGG